MRRRDSPFRPGARSVAAALALLATLALLGCGDDGEDEPQEPTVQRTCSAQPPGIAGWDGVAPVDPTTGEIDVSGFNAYLKSADPPISTSPCDAAHVFAAGIVEDGPEVTVNVAPEGTPEATATIVAEGLEDDSIAAQRWTLQFAGANGDRIKVVQANTEYRCQKGRGQRNFSSELCL
ncbi:MAG TPA: hypothetical protein VIL04_03560 [Solirubrobacterales bacterium]|jgi:hypothetical protein